jgi:hypothetical protein
MLTLVAGVEPVSPGFASVRIAPHLGNLTALSASYPHPAGPIGIEYKLNGSALGATITLPGKLTGTFEYQGRTWPLAPGVNQINTP